MKNAAATVVLLGLLSACAQPAPPPPPPPAPAPAPAAEAPQVDRYVQIRQARCDTFLGLSPDDRAAASMFYIGYEASRYRTSNVNVALIPEIGGMAVNFCEVEPNRRVADAFAESISVARGWSRQWSRQW